MFDSVVPAGQRRSLAELDERLDLSVGDRQAKRSAFWTMLALSAVIAVAGVVSDSTATVIGAMIVAPLSTPILGVGLGITVGRRALIVRSIVRIVAGIVLVVVLGVLFARVLPNPGNVLANSQVLGRTSPTLMDLVAALATGLVGAVAVARRDVGDVLPGVAIAISLVPPLGVVGVCLGSGAPTLALGAFVLFASNAVALIITATLVLVAAGYGRDAAREGGSRWRRAYLVLSVALVVVSVPMVVNSLASLWAEQISARAELWLDQTPGAQVTGVQWRGTTVTVSVLGPASLPPVAELDAAVQAIVPWDPQLQVVHTVGSTIEQIEAN
ncbi:MULTISPECIES: TIGR00341 family protein [Rhodococcus]|uniref:TIGR00341 family protein n=1 Tax=Rhodococcus TaxID=1827 RepID=UPI000B5A4CCB|nr:MULTISPECIES: TIGR00341 family protein [Rhodococcus]MCW3470419.1 TIGR00341 family protein [Rhodococcus pyridinivorans]OWY79612.1 TIGR00341 family protein [Rhodococcus sp. BUPNP1]